MDVVPHMRMSTVAPLLYARQLRFQAAIETDRTLSKSQDLEIQHIGRRYQAVFLNPMPIVVYFSERGQKAKLVFPQSHPLAQAFVKMINPSG
jgi:hypothetical protein